MGLKYKHSSKTKAQWEALNPVIVENEIVIEKDTKRLKVGDGVRKYDELPYVTRSYSKLQEVEFSTSENVGNKKRIEDCEEIRLTLYRNIDGAVVRNVSASVGNNGYISLLHMFPDDTEIVGGIEYRVKYQLIDDINIGTYYETWIDEVNAYGTTIASEFTLTINTI